MYYCNMIGYLLFFELNSLDGGIITGPKTIWRYYDWSKEWRVIVKELLFYIQFINWLYTCLNLYFVSFHLNYCSWCVVGCFTRSDYFVWLWNDYYFTFNSLITYLLAYFCMLFPFIWIIVSGKFVAVLGERIFWFWLLIL